MAFFATLQGGPKDGQVVEIIGLVYRFAEKLPQGGFRTGVYEWDYYPKSGNVFTDTPTDETKYIGTWKGYEGVNHEQ